MKWMCGVLGLLILAPIFGQTLPQKPISVDIHNKERLQRGAKWFMNYCSGCHSLQYLRYNRMAKDLGITTFDGQVNQDLLKSNLIFTKASVYDPIRIAMPAASAKKWFGIVPPDLSLTAREKSPAWIYNYLNSFYYDNSRPFHSNNVLVPEVAMPDVLAPLRGKMVLVKEDNGDSFHFLLAEPGEIYPEEFDSILQDLVTFLTYVSEPVKLIRYRLGIGVLLFLMILLIPVYGLKRFYWSQHEN